jgi:hypothetical protein
MKRLLAAVLTCLIMGGMIGIGLRRPVDLGPDPSASRLRPDGPGAGPGPDLSGASDRIESLLEGARKGDLSSYLGSFEGALRARLERQADERGRAAFAADLQHAAGARKSHAVFAPQPDGDPSGSVRIVVESTFAERIERQSYRLVRTRPGWRIIEFEIARERLPEKPLGSLATYQEPEGVPVATDQMTKIRTAGADSDED